MAVMHAETPGDATSSPDSADERPVGARRGVWTVVVGGGSGQRFGKPKQYEKLGDRRVIDWSVDMAFACSEGVIVVVPAGDAKREGAVPGGATRSDSVRAGLAHVPAEADVICVHDAARPLASAGLYKRVIAEIRAGADAVVPGIAVSDTIKLLAEPFDSSGSNAGRVAETPDRARLVAVQTPQAFGADVLRRAHADGRHGTDDAALIEQSGGTVVVVAGEQANRKITDPDDLVWVAERLHMVHDTDRLEQHRSAP